MSFPNNRHGNTPPYLLSAYGIAVKHGYSGTEEEWLASLKGDEGEYPRLSYQIQTSGDVVRHGIFYRYADEGDWTNLCWLDDLMTAAEADIINAAKEYADLAEAYAKGTVDDEDVEEGDPGYEDNAKYYAGQASDSATAAAGSASDAASSAASALSYKNLATQQAQLAQTQAAAAANSANSAATAQNAAYTYAGSASTSAQSAQAQAVQAGTYAYNADQSAQQAASYAAASGNYYAQIIEVANGVAAEADDVEAYVTAAAAAQTAAETAATNASGSATAAAGSATDAAGSATAAAGSADEAEAVLNSIPEDYSTLSNDVTDLKSAVSNIYPLAFINMFVKDFESGAIAAADGSTSDSTTRERTIDYIPTKYKKAAVNNSTVCDLAVFCWDANNQYVGCYNGNGTFVTNVINWTKDIELPEGYKSKIVWRRADNKTVRHNQAPVRLYFNQLSASEANNQELEQKEDKKDENILDFINLEYVAYQYRDDSGAELYVADSGYIKSKISVEPNTKYKIINNGYGSVFRVYWLDEDGEWISRSTPIDCYNGVQFKTPGNCYYIQMQIGLTSEQLCDENAGIEKVVQTKPVFLDTVTDYISSDLPSYTSKATTGGVNEIYEAYDALVTAYPEYVSKTLLGQDQSGTYNIYEYKFRPETAGYYSEHFGGGTVETINEVDLPIILADGCIHGDEKLGTLVLKDFCTKLCNTWSDNDTLTFCRWNIEFRVIPIANPWGYNNNVRTNSEGKDINRQATKDNTELEVDCIEAVILKTWLKSNQSTAFAYLDLHTQWAGKDRDIAWYISPENYLDQTLNSVITKLTRNWKKTYSFINYSGLMGFVGRATYITPEQNAAAFREYAFMELDYKNSITVECANTAQYNNETKFGQLTANMYMDIFMNLLAALAQIAGANYVPSN